MILSRIRTLLLPSLLSAITTLSVSAVVLLAAVFSLSNGSGLIYDYLFGPGSSSDLISSARGSVDAFNNTVFGNVLLNKILYFGLWMLVGLLVYMILYLVIRGASAAAEDFEQTTYKNANAELLMREFAGRAGLRAIAALCWFMYWIFFIKTLLPFSVLSARIGADAMPGMNGWVYGAVGLLTIMLSTHIHVIFLRLVALKARLFGAQS